MCLSVEDVLVSDALHELVAGDGWQHHGFLRLRMVSLCLLL